jgi:hypothetical protein
VHISQANRKGRRFLGSFISAITTIAIISGCATPSDIEWSVHEPIEASSFGSEWDSSIGRMGVAPVLPPSEDVRVGDIFVYPFNPDHLVSAPNRIGGLAIIPRWASMNLLKELDEEYRLRPEWPKTPDTYFQISDTPNNREWAEPQAPESKSIFAEEGTTDRLRIMGIPEFQSITIADANALVPTEAINLAVGTAWNDNKAITIRMNAVETYSLGLQKVIDAALETDAQGSVLKAPYRDHLALVSDPASSSVWVRVLSDVIYVRGIDIIIQSQSAFDDDEASGADEFISEADETVEPVEKEPAVEEEAKELAEGEEGEEPAEGEEAEAQPMQTVTEIIPDHDLDPAYAAFVRANAINDILIESDSDDLPGGYLRLIAVTDDSVTVRRIWQRGLAIGARGLTLEVDKLTGQVLRSSNMGTLLPPPPSPPVPAAE